MIDPDELRRLRNNVARILGRMPEPLRTSRITTTDWVERDRTDEVEFCFDDRTLDFSRQLMNASLGMWVLCASGTGCHRDIPSLDGLQDDLRLNGPPYLQWNVAHYQDSFLHVIPGSHTGESFAAEQCRRAQNRAPYGDGTVAWSNRS